MTNLEILILFSFIVTTVLIIVGVANLGSDIMEVNKQVSVIVEAIVSGEMLVAEVITDSSECR